MIRLARQLALGLTHTPRPIRPRIVALLLGTLVVGCEPMAPEVVAHPSWRIVDSSWVTPWDELTDSVAVYRVAFTVRGRVDTLSDILPPWPVVVDDSTVWGLRKAPQQLDRVVFRWSASPRTLRTWSLPDDVMSGFNDVMISPRGEFVAYAGSVDGRPYPIVRTLPTGSVIFQGPTAAGCDCDVDLSHARWVSADSFEIAVVSSANERGWAVWRGSASRRQANLAYQDSEPDWHAGPRREP